MITNLCKHCGKMFKSYTPKACCKACTAIDDEEFRKIEQYLKQYPNSNALQISEGLDISPFDIIRFIDEGRLSVVKGEFKKLD